MCIPKISEFTKKNPSLLSCLPLEDKLCDMFDFCGNTSSNSTGAWSRHAFVELFPITQQSYAFWNPPRTSPINASGAKNVEQCHQICPPVQIHSLSSSCPGNLLQ